ncbi:DNA-binding FrmR family transcriptional regulator [Scopulibacillus darangshiensis]|uniref:DNA-binding FrmR family transcriptional regulator n=1 Tax=Scopulibacillus darangshiensis TaxID=442528 RepID=A0A4R2P4B2_9BACL|nr:metal-sensitive transcriptional regulator [Scopulibacillus darangshiensis]TCP28894.1 DNA-binding FrmR family transcriptional regulator [Scopulibacillus darangshiensis]
MEPKEHTDKKPLEPRTNKEKEQVINRLKRIEGQVRGIQNMVENDRYCMDILIQLSAIQSAIKKVGYSVMERHTKMCVAHSIKNGDDDSMIDELLEIIQQYSK